MSEIAVSVARSAGWAGASQFGRTLVQLATAAVLARLLDPADYGLMAMALGISALATIFRDMGTGAALVQREGFDDRLVVAVLRLNVIVGLALSLLCLALARDIANLLAEPRLAPVLMVLAPSFFIASLGVVPQSCLERESQFRALAGLELASVTGAALIAIAAAYGGLGVYALVAQTVSAAVLSTLLLWWRCPWRPRGDGTLRDAAPLLGFSGNLLAFNLLNYVHRNADTFLIARFLGASDLGFYSAGYRVILFPLQNLTFVLARVLLPAYSREQGRPSDVATHYLELLGGIAFVTAPLTAMVWAIREPLVTLLLGSRWTEAAHVMAWLAPVGLCQSLVSTSGSVFLAFGKTDVLRNLGIMSVPFLVGAIVIGLPWGIEGVAAAYCVANVIWVYPVLSRVMRIFGESFASALRAVWRPVLVALGAALLTRWFGAWMIGQGVTAPTSIPLQLIAGLLLYLAVCALLRVQTLAAVTLRVKTLFASVLATTGRQA